MTMSQTGHFRQAGISGVAVKDDTAFRTANGLGGSASNLKCVPYMEGYLFVGVGAPTFSGTGKGTDRAFDYSAGVEWLNASTGSTWKAVSYS